MIRRGPEDTLRTLTRGRSNLGCFFVVVPNVEDSVLSDPTTPVPPLYFSSPVILFLFLFLASFSFLFLFLRSRVATLIFLPCWIEKKELTFFLNLCFALSASRCSN